MSNALCLRGYNSYEVMAALMYWTSRDLPDRLQSNETIVIDVVCHRPKHHHRQMAACTHSYICMYMHVLVYIHIHTKSQDIFFSLQSLVIKKRFSLLIQNLLLQIKIFSQRRLLSDSPVSVVGSGLNLAGQSYSVIEVGLNRQKWADCHPDSVLRILEGQC